MNKKITKVRKNTKVDKTVVIVSVICIFIVTAVLLAFILPEPIEAAVKLSKLREDVSGDGISAVNIRSTEGNGEDILDDGVQLTLRDDDAKEMAKRLEKVLKNAKYNNTSQVSTGVWKTKITVYNYNENAKLYIDENGIYIAENTKLISFVFEDDGKKEFDALYSDIVKMLENA